VHDRLDDDDCNLAVVVVDSAGDVVEVVVTADERLGQSRHEDAGRVVPDEVRARLDPASLRRPVRKVAAQHVVVETVVTALELQNLLASRHRSCQE